MSSYLEVVAAQIQMYPTEASTVTYDPERKLALVDLYRALGGGWNLGGTGGGVVPAQTPTP